MRKIIPVLLIAALSCTFAACSFINGSSADSSTSDSSVKESVTSSKEQSSSIVESVDSISDSSSDSSFDSSVEEPHEHELTVVEEVAATCLQEGNITYWQCSGCSLLFSDENGETQIAKADTVLAKSSHTMTHFDAVEALGYTEGNIEYWQCSVCENYYKDAGGTKKISLGSTVIAAPYSIPDFVVEVEEGRDPIVLQLSDTQIIDAAQAREGRTGVDYTFWATDQVEERCYDYLTELINATNPDLIILTGDIIYGEFDDNGTALVSFVEFMETFQTPWAPVFGNHDNESKKGADWQCEQFENAQYCLFEQKELTGNGNYSVAIAQGGEVKRVFYMLDTNGCGGASAESLANGHTTKSVGFASDQIQWYTEQIKELKKVAPEVKISFAYHIQQYVFMNAFNKYDFNQSETYQDINIDTLEEKEEGDFGYIGRQLKGPWDASYSVWNGMKSLGVDSIFIGHEHCNSASVVYNGVRFQFGQKSSEYDRFNCIDENGAITGGYSKTGTSLIGGTVIPLSAEDGSIKDPYIYYCGFENGEIDWTKYKEYEVGGLQKGTELYVDGALTMNSVAFDETTNAYEVVAISQGKMYVNVALLKGKTTFTFSVYVPETSTAKLGGYGEFAIRVKPNGDEPVLDGKVDGYIDFNSSATIEELKLEFGVWKTYTVDITGLDATCTEFAFVIAASNVLYFKDVTLS